MKIGVAQNAASVTQTRLPRFACADCVWCQRSAPVFPSKRKKSFIFITIKVMKIEPKFLEVGLHKTLPRLEASLAIGGARKLMRDVLNRYDLKLDVSR